MPYPSDANDLSALLAFAGMLFFLTGKALHAAWSVRFNTGVDRGRPITQRRRYQVVALATTVSLSLTMFIFIQYNPQQVLAVLDEFRSVNPSFGWALTISLMLQMLAPAFAVLTTIQIYRKPALFARRLRNGYYLRTIDHRNETTPPVLYAWPR